MKFQGWTQAVEGKVGFGKAFNGGQGVRIAFLSAVWSQHLLLIINGWQICHIGRLIGNVFRLQHRGTHWWAPLLYQKHRSPVDLKFVVYVKLKSFTFGWRGNPTLIKLKDSKWLFKTFFFAFVAIVCGVHSPRELATISVFYDMTLKEVQIGFQFGL